MRFSALRKSIPDISQKMLTVTLRTLEEDGFVKRKMYPEIPPRVEYSLTSKGRELVPFLRQICKWASQYHRPGANEDAELAHCKVCVVRAAGLKK